MKARSTGPPLTAPSETKAALGCMPPTSLAILASTRFRCFNEADKPPMHYVRRGVQVSMTSPAKNKKRKEEQRQRSRSGQLLVTNNSDGTVTYAVHLVDASPPEDVVYTNAATAVREGATVSFFFAQYVAVGKRPEHVLRIDMPAHAVAMLGDSMEPIRNRVERFKNEVMPPFDPQTEGRSAEASHADAARVIVNEFMTIVDFYQIVPRPGVAGDALPVVRVLGATALLPFVATQCERLGSVEAMP